MKTLSIWFTVGVLTSVISTVGCGEEDGGVDGPPWSCHYDQEMTGPDGKGCYEYDASVPEEEARAACEVHKVGGVLNVPQNRTLRGGPCDLDDVSGYCSCSCSALPGKEYIQYKELYVDDPSADCVMDPDEINSIYGCEEMVGGTYTCTVQD